MKVVLDTNVYISGIFFTGPPYQVLEAWRDARIQIVVSPGILDEYQRVGETLASQFPNIDLQPILELLTLNAEVVPSEGLAESKPDAPLIRNSRPCVGCWTGVGPW